MGMMPRFAKFQTLLERINAIAKENLRGVRGQIFVRSTIWQIYRGFCWDYSAQNLYIGYAFSVIEPVMMLVGYGAVFSLSGWWLEWLSQIRL